MKSERSLVAVTHTRLFSGAERVLTRMLDAAIDSGWEVTLCAPDGPVADHLRSAGAHIVRIPELKPSQRRRVVALGGLVGAELRASRPIRAAAASADLVLVNGLMALPAVAMARPQPPLCWFIHDVPVRRSLRAVARAVAPFVDSAFAPSAMAAAFPRELGISTTVSANGTPFPAVDPPAAVSGPSVVGISAALTPWKGQHVLLEAMASVPNAIVEIMGTTFPGDEAYERQLRELASTPELEGRVRFLGHVPEPLERMRSWSVCVSASVEPEAGSLVLLEAMGVGLPIVATAHGCSAEYLGEAGVLVEPGDSSGLATAIGRLLREREYATTLGAAARRRVAADYTLEMSQARFLREIDVLTDVGGRR